MVDFSLGPGQPRRSVVYVRAQEPRGRINFSVDLSSDQIFGFDDVARVAYVCAVG